MCGRYSFAVEDDLIRERFGVTVRSTIYKARYNCAPTQDLAVISNNESDRLNFFRWGLIPFWAKDPSIGYKLINAKSETVHEKPAFKNSFKYRRCLVPCDGFYEWKKEKVKIPFRIIMKDAGPFAMAGIWDKWASKAGEIIHSFSILTTGANALMSSIHDRMPVILRPEEEKRWLEEPDANDLLPLLQPYPAELMTAYPVSSLVNSPKNDSADIILKV